MYKQAQNIYSIKHSKKIVDFVRNKQFCVFMTNKKLSRNDLKVLKNINLNFQQKSYFKKMRLINFYRSNKEELDKLRIIRRKGSMEHK